MHGSENVNFDSNHYQKNNFYEVILSVEIIADFCASLCSVAMEEVQSLCLLKKIVQAVATVLKCKPFYDTISYVDKTNRTAYVLITIAGLISSSL
jgi:putative component of membrane protein insertase Oxa1/YidC/SpoIIIJ protein YidD